jgi:hypothetical protein
MPATDALCNPAWLASASAAARMRSRVSSDFA